MSDGTFYGCILLLVVSGITLTVLAARGFGQSSVLRVLDGLVAETLRRRSTMPMERV